MTPAALAKKSLTTEVQDSRPFTPDGLAEYIDVSRNTLAQWRYRGQGPKFIKVGKKVIYRRTDVEEWLAENTQQCTAEVSRVA